MLAKLPVEIILLICEYPEFTDLGQLAWTNKRMMQIMKKYLPIALEIAFERKVLFYGPDPPEWREYASVAYIKGKLYYLGGADPKAHQYTNRVDMENGKQDLLFLFELVVFNHGDDRLKSCLRFEPSALVDRRISRIADMNSAKGVHSLVVASGKLYAIGGFKQFIPPIFLNSIEEYDPQTNEWREVGEMSIKLSLVAERRRPERMVVVDSDVHSFRYLRLCLLPSAHCHSGRIASFTIDTQMAGTNLLFVGVVTTKGPVEEVTVRHQGNGHYVVGHFFVKLGISNRMHPFEWIDR
ncbi:hypothetical protein WR25_20503 [Diploscapter pachys]|uniref:F-box domain-containing protein n=1 Tax=Diploscapter pachys TaxID=2018661 RepID=A0A2A2JRV1_9BILA|nr:hypothetical protein WR25_20503 [Diploscapter pachys]